MVCATLPTKLFNRYGSAVAGWRSRPPALSAHWADARTLSFLLTPRIPLPAALSSAHYQYRFKHFIRRALPVLPPAMLKGIAVTDQANILSKASGMRAVVNHHERCGILLLTCLELNYSFLDKRTETQAVHFVSCHAVFHATTAGTLSYARHSVQPEPKAGPAAAPTNLVPCRSAPSRGNQRGRKARAWADILSLQSIFVDDEEGEEGEDGYVIGKGRWRAKMA